MRRLGVAVALLLVACASIGAPPGGPQRDVPPALERVTPDSGAVNVRADHVTFDFDVVVSDRPTGVPALEDAFVISPREGEPKVSWRRDRIEVRPKRGFRPNTAYAVTMLPGIADLRGNVRREGLTIVFSTGPSIPPFAVHGRVFDWMSGRVAPRAIVDVIRRPDSLPYIGWADSTGQFSVGPLSEGTYTARAYIDANNNRTLDVTEAWDSATVTVHSTSPFIELLAAPRDTFPPRILTATPQDSVTLAVDFDRPLDPRLPLTPESFRVVASDSSRLRVARVRPRARAGTAGQQEPDSARAPSQRADSTRQARDTIAARTRDTIAAPARDTIPARRRDTAEVRLVPAPSLPSPATSVILQLDSLTPMRTGVSYRVSATGVRGLLGASRPSERVILFEPPRRPPPGTRPDSTKARRP